jgi:hypothetical protein
MGESIMSMQTKPRDDVGDVQWVVVCLDPEYGAPEVYAAWDTETEAATWLDEEHLERDNEVWDDDIPKIEERLFCKNDASDLDHYVVSVIDCT